MVLVTSNSKQVAVLSELCKFRDAKARELDRPLFKVIGDQSLIKIATASPVSIKTLETIPGISQKQVRWIGRGLLSAVKRGLNNQPPKRPKKRRHDPAYINRVEVLRTWRKETARGLDVESDVVLPKDLLYALAKSNPKNNQEMNKILVSVPWRKSKFGDTIFDLLKSLNNIGAKYMRINFHGAAQTVTGSQHLLEINGHTLLLECGLYQGRRKESYDRNRNFYFSPAEVDFVILSHAHIDHSGNLPHLVKKGFEGPIFATPATAHLGNIMLLDSGHIHEYDAQFVNKKRKKRGEPPIEPLYTQEDAARVAQQFQTYHYEQAFEPIPGVKAHFVDAGHILGSAAVVLDINESGRKFRLWFSGDIGRRDLPLLRDPVLPEDVDYLLMECTYGDKPHVDPQLAFEELRRVVSKTVRRGGKVIIPAFAVGRTQELVYCLHRMIDSGDIPKIPVFVDSPLAVNASDIFKAHPYLFDGETQAFMKADKHHSALGFDLLTYTRSVEELKAINFVKGPAIIISASGMAETGRILHHLRNNIENSNNTILIVSWQAPHTLGRRLADREVKVKIFGERYHRKAEVATIGGLSAHGGQSFLLEYALASWDTIRKIFLVHGEERGALPMIEKLHKAGMSDVYFPEFHDSFEL